MPISLLITIDLLLILGLVRVFWVQKSRMRVIDQWGHEGYERLPSYNHMVLNFWIWDVKKFLKGAQK
ncbi:hypothetical protein ACEV60_20090 [Enterobacter ludwigii]|uniref:hypothetical protein n=1 Tax=Enterobacter TaxID=547 RepID=UPI0006438996|nr:hypothetical protein [Enterobacter ludwigii]KLP40834.1 hypothetical protein ABR36_09030 [Enterobacter ludwigii]